MQDSFEGNAIEPLLDDELWPPLQRAIREARSEVLLTQLLFEPAFRVGERALADELEGAAARGARVRILVNENAAIPDSYDDLAERFEGTSVEVTRLLMTPNVMHAKLCVVDAQEAFLVDAPFEQKYVDSSLHAFRPTRGRTKPFHSVSLRVRGPVVAGLRHLAGSLFAEAGTDAPAPAPAPPPAGRLPARIAWTAPDGLHGDGHQLNILREYERAIARAKRLIYIENQYFTSPRIADAIGAALEREPELEVVLLLNVHMDVPSYDVWLRRRLEELGARDHPRLGAFALWAPRRLDGKGVARQVYIHSKVAVVDDAWATVGSANLDSISLHEAQEFPLPRRVPPNVEANIVVEDEAFAAMLRRRLWGEHLDDQGVWRADPPAGGWLAHWHRVAQENLRAFDASEPARAGRVFPYELIASERREALFRGSAAKR
jgi:phosphatidylserine/phosphatidylglycerophosphate/cardiolipin synthase-like enzyme